MIMETIIIGTRGSRLSLVQTEIVVDKIKRIFPTLGVKVEVIKTLGDVKKNMKLDGTEQKGVFVKDIDRRLIEGKIDLAVHSLKDIPTKLSDAVKIGAIVERGDPRDVLISNGNKKLKDLKKNAKIGTSSLRRKSQMLAFRKDLKVIEMRGNVDKRLAELDAGNYDAIVLAASGIERLGEANRISEYLPFNVMLPAPGQGALAIGIRSDDKTMTDIVSKLDDGKIRAAVEAERVTLSRIGGGCNALLGIFAEVKEGKLYINAAVTSNNGNRKYRYKQEGDIKFPEEAGLMLAEKILMSGAANIVGSKKQRSPLNGKIVAVTREEGEGEGIYQMLLEKGAVPVYFPTIKTVDLQGKKSDIRPATLKKYDIIIITSRRGASMLLKYVNAAAIKARIVAIGRETKRYLQEKGTTVDYMPESSYSNNIISGLTDIKGKKILIINSAKATNKLLEELINKGGKVDRITPYTITKPNISKTRKKAIIGYKFDFVTFASPSAVEGFISILGKRNAGQILANSKVVCIGDTTSKKCADEEITVHMVSEEHTLSGIVSCIENSSSKGHK